MFACRLCALTDLLVPTGFLGALEGWGGGPGQMASAEGSGPEGGPLMDPRGANGKSQKTPRPEGKKGALLPPGRRGCGAAPR